MSEFQRFYSKGLIPELAKDVWRAELSRQNGMHAEVLDIYDKWAGLGRIEELLVVLEARAALSDLVLEQHLIKVGLAGLGRIRHVDANSRLKTYSEEHGSIIDEIGQIDQLYRRLDVETLPHFSIHGGPMYWSLEIDQDQASTDIILGDLEGADEILHRAMDQGIAICRELKPIVDLETDDEFLRASNYSAYKDRKSYLGALSALGVVEARIARKNNNLSLLLEATAHAYESHSFEPNPHRIATLSLWLIRASFNPEFQANLFLRPIGLIFGSVRLAQMVGIDSHAVLSSIKQMIAESKKKT